jgi:hypothetical protein
VADYLWLVRSNTDLELSEKSGLRLDTDTAVVLLTFRLGHSLGPLKIISRASRSAIGESDGSLMLIHTQFA